MADQTLTLDYYFDPLCGWCYASAPALHALAEAFPDALTMRPSGLFFERRPVSQIADHAERNDRRIQALTGQPFSEAYHQGVMRAPDGIFGSDMLTRALVALGQHDKRLEPQVLHAAQIARYVAGQDTSQAEAVAEVAVAVAARAGLTLDRDAFAARLTGDAALAQLTLDRMRDTQLRQQSLPGGVPLLVVSIGDRSFTLNGEAIYGPPDALLQMISELAAGQEA